MCFYCILDFHLFPPGFSPIFLTIGAYIFSLRNFRKCCSNVWVCLRLESSLDRDVVAISSSQFRWPNLHTFFFIRKTLTLREKICVKMRRSRLNFYRNIFKHILWIVCWWQREGELYHLVFFDPGSCIKKQGKFAKNSLCHRQPVLSQIQPLCSLAMLSLFNSPRKVWVIPCE